MDVKTKLQDSFRNFSSGASKGAAGFADLAGSVSVLTLMLSVGGLAGKAVGKAFGWTPDVSSSEEAVVALGSLLFMWGSDFVKDGFNELSKKIETEPNELGLSSGVGRVAGFAAATALTFAIAYAANQVIGQIDLAEPDQEQHIEESALGIQLPEQQI